MHQNPPYQEVQTSASTKFSPHQSTGERCALRLYSRHVHNCYSVGITLYTAARDMIPNSTICTFGGNCKARASAW